ncbi:MAG: hypothetical protein QUV07_08600 [Cyanobium sp. CZS 25K]|nr:hypothetical protein [Cyanobium sp. CZS25K]
MFAPLVASQGSRAAVAATTKTYLPPSLLEDVHVLDFLELSGSQYEAANHLAMHQSTVSRSLSKLQHELELAPGRRSAACRYGRNACLDMLRLSCRAHRLMKGFLRIGTDPLHQTLLSKQASLQTAPSRFRKVTHWVDLIHHGVLDGAIVSSMGMEKSMPAGSVPCWHGVVIEPLGVLPLELMARSTSVKGVLVPNRAAAPMLHRALEGNGHKLLSQPRAAQEPAAWLNRMRDRELSLPLCPGLVGKAWLSDHSLAPLQASPPLQEAIWLLLPQALEPPATAARPGSMWCRQQAGDNEI